MSQQRFSDIDRRALWEAHRKRCLYCRQPLLFKELLIDHVVPEALLRDSARWANIRASHGLDETFDLQGDGNLAPACHPCNSEKLDHILPPGRLAILLARIQERIPEVGRLRAKYEQSAGADDVILGLICAMQSGTIQGLEVNEILRRFESSDIDVTLYRSIEFVDGAVVSQINKAKVEELLDRPIKLGTDLPAGLEFIHKDGSTVGVRTTREYRTAIQKGYYAPTTFAIKMEAFFKLPLAVLTVVEHARPAEHSFIREPRVGIVDLDVMPVSMLPTMTGEHEEHDCRTLAEVKAKGKLLVQSTTSHSLDFEYGGMSRILVEVLRMDLNGDGIEDILLYGYDRAIGGTFGAGFTIALTRTSPTGLLEEVDWHHQL
jgi:hypothetical protein